MRFEKLDLNLLVALEALLQEQNVTAAADRVCLSQSAMSGVLNRLRDYFGDELLVKVGRQMALTPRAQTLVEPVRNALLIIKNTIATAPEFIPAEAQRKFTLSTSDYFLDINLSGVMRRLGKEAPGVSIDVVLPDENTQTKFERVDIDLVVALEQYMSNDHPYEVL
ncbi:MAG: LysR family transcriptional regulator, partial [Rhodospirillaceae bacterium]|nr:LysR family transcriptional regulator [Rhodospirillaceae bacterium]